VALWVLVGLFMAYGGLLQARLGLFGDFFVPVLSTSALICAELRSRKLLAGHNHAHGSAGSAKARECVQHRNEGVS